jgi:hypothetical protein
MSDAVIVAIISAICSVLTAVITAIVAPLVLKDRGEGPDRTATRPSKAIRWLVAGGLVLGAVLGYILAIRVIHQPYFADGSLVRSESLNKPAVYVVYGGAKFWIPSPEVFNRMGFRSDEVQNISDSAIAAIPDVPSDGTLLKEISTPSVYVIQEGVKRHVLSPTSVVTLGNKVHIVPDCGLAHIPTGNDFP